MSLSVKAADAYVPIAKLYQKSYGTYFPANQIYVKEGGVYVGQGYSWNNGPVVDFIVPLGSSTTLYAFDSGGSYNINQQQIVRQRFCEMGIDVPILTNYFATDGGTTTSLKNMIDAGLLGIDAVGIAAKGIKIGFAINIGNNDIVGYRYDSGTYDPTWDPGTANAVNAWPVASDAMKATITANLRYIVAAIVAAGHEPMLGTINPRGGLSVFAEFQKWNDGIVKPLIHELCPQWVNSDGNPVYDMEWLYHWWNTDATNPNSYYLPAHDWFQWYYTDGTHPSLIAIDKIQRYLAQSFGQFAKAPRLTNQTHSILIAFQGQYIYQKGGLNQVCVMVGSTSTQTPSQTGLYDRRGNYRAEASFTISGYQSITSSSKGNLGVYKLNLENHNIQKSSTINWNNAPIYVDISLGAAFSGRTGQVKVTLATTTTWGSIYTVQGVSLPLTGNGTGPQIATFNCTLDGTGSVRITCMRGVGGYYNGISGAELIID